MESLKRSDDGASHHEQSDGPPISNSIWRTDYPKSSARSFIMTKKTGTRNKDVNGGSNHAADDEGGDLLDLETASASYRP
jgi:hypothetical protein